MKKLNLCYLIPIFLIMMIISFSNVKAYDETYLLAPRQYIDKNFNLNKGQKLVWSYRYGPTYPGAGFVSFQYYIFNETGWNKKNDGGAWSEYAYKFYRSAFTDFTHEGSGEFTAPYKDHWYMLLGCEGYTSMLLSLSIHKQMIFIRPEVLVLIGFGVFVGILIIIALIDKSIKKSRKGEDQS